LKSKGLDASKLPMVAKGRELLERLQALSLREGQLKAEIQLASLEERLEGARKGRRDLSLYGTPQALREALAREVQATQEALDELLATLGLRPEDLFLSEDSLMEAKGVKREALPLVGQARQYLEALRSLKAEGIGDLVLLERPGTLEGFRQAVFRAAQALAPELTQWGLEAFWNALAEAAGDTPLG
ncbi:hypothetical protein, partial [Thermus sp.]|uniref:hypothetical protein n=1 Tax=Thermus sp. TaxID=275 RepID=UPI002618E230